MVFYLGTDPDLNVWWISSSSNGLKFRFLGASLVALDWSLASSKLFS